MQSRQPIRKKYLYPHEVFSRLKDIPSFHDRVKFLQENQSFAIRTILQCNFTPSLVLDLPPGSPPFERDTLPVGNSMARIDKAIKVLGKIAIQEGTAPSVGLSKIKKETLFIELLESINSADADVILQMKEKTLSSAFPQLDETLVKTSFPSLF